MKEKRTGLQRLAKARGCKGRDVRKHVMHGFECAVIPSLPRHNGRSWRVLRPPPRARPPLRPARAPHARSRAAARARAAPRARGRVAFVLSMLRKPSTTASSARCKVVTGGSALGRPMLQGRRTYPTDGFELQRTPATTPNSPATAHCRTRTYPCTLPSTCSSRPGVSSGVSGIGRRVSTRRTKPTAKHLPS